MTGRRVFGRQPAARPVWLRPLAGVLAGVLAVGLAAGLLWWAWPDSGRPGLPAPTGRDLPPRSAAVNAAPVPPPLPGALAAQRAPAASAAGWAAAGVAGAADGLASGAAASGQRPQSATLARCQAEAAAAKRALPAVPTNAAEAHQAHAALAALQFVEPDPALLAAAWDRTARQLQGSPQPRQQAAALMMGRPGMALTAPGAPAPVAALTSLVSLALASADPTVLQWATGACLAPGAQAACQGLSARVWVQAEPDNLLAWLPLLAQEPQAREEVLQGMAQARRADGGWMRWATLVNTARPADLPPALRHAFALHLTSAATSGPMPAWQGLLRACSAESLADARRRGQCQQIAQLMVDQGREMMTVLLGYSMGERLGWPPEREQSRRALRSAMAHAGPDLWVPGTSLACSAELHEHWMMRVDQLGEAELARQWLRATASAAAAAPAAGPAPPAR